MDKQILTHIRAININRFLLVLMIVIAAASIVGSFWMEDQCYSFWTSVEEGAPSERAVSIMRAIALKPSEMSGYIKLLDVYIEDGTLTKKEYAQYQETLLRYQSKLAGAKGDLSGYYRTLADTYMSHYDASVQQRLKAAYPHFEQANHYPHQQDQGQMIVETYLQLSDYYANYIWLTGTLRKPTANEVRDLIRLSRSMLDSFPETAVNDRLALACVLADMVAQHGTMWEDVAGTDTVTELVAHILKQTETAATDPAGVRLQEELTAWKNEIQPGEEVIE